MKEVKLFLLADFVRDPDPDWPSNKQMREEIELNLASWLTAGWQIQGSGGSSLAGAFVILVREKEGR